MSIETANNGVKGSTFIFSLIIFLEFVPTEVPYVQHNIKYCVVCVTKYKLKCVQYAVAFRIQLHKYYRTCTQKIIIITLCPVLQYLWYVWYHTIE